MLLQTSKGRAASHSSGIIAAQSLSILHWIAAHSAGTTPMVYSSGTTPMAHSSGTTPIAHSSGTTPMGTDGAGTMANFHLGINGHRAVTNFLLAASSMSSMELCIANFHFGGINGHAAVTNFHLGHQWAWNKFHLGHQWHGAVINLHLGAMQCNELWSYD